MDLVGGSVSWGLIFRLESFGALGCYNHIREQARWVSPYHKQMGVLTHADSLQAPLRHA